MINVGVSQWSIDEVTPPAVEPVALADVKAELSIPSAATAFDARITRLITDARLFGEHETGLQFVTATYDLFLDTFPGGDGVIEVPRPPLQSITSVKYYDTDEVLQTWAAANYEADTTKFPGRLRPVDGEVWPDTFDRMRAVEIRFVAGFGATAADVPEDIVSDIIRYVGLRFRAADGVLSGVTVTTLPGMEPLFWKRRLLGVA